jgi:hypothetical protein
VMSIGEGLLRLRTVDRRKGAVVESCTEYSVPLHSRGEAERSVVSPKDRVAISGLSLWPEDGLV